MLEAIGHVFIKLVQSTVGDATVVVIGPLTLLKGFFINTIDLQSQSSELT